MKHLLLLLLFLSASLHAQVGINRIDPQADLHVGGSMLVQNLLKVTNLPTVTATDKDFKLIARKKVGTPIGELKLLDTDVLSVAPVNVINYEFTNVNLDDISDLNLQYNTSKYIVAVTNFRYEGDAIKKVTVAATGNPSAESIGNFVVNTFESGGTWHLEIRNRTLNLDISDSLTYYVSLVVYDKSYYRNLAVIVTDLGGSNTGAASSIPVID